MGRLSKAICYKETATKYPFLIFIISHCFNKNNDFFSFQALMTRKSITSGIKKSGKSWLYLSNDTKGANFSFRYV
jgi:hypothetical protein